MAVIVRVCGMHVHVCMCTCVYNRHVTLEVCGTRAFQMNEREGHLSSEEKG